MSYLKHFDIFVDFQANVKLWNAFQHISKPTFEMGVSYKNVILQKKKKI